MDGSPTGVGVTCVVESGVDEAGVVDIGDADEAGNEFASTGLNANMRSKVISTPIAGSGA